MSWLLPLKNYTAAEAKYYIEQNYEEAAREVEEREARILGFEKMLVEGQFSPVLVAVLRSSQIMEETEYLIAKRIKLTSFHFEQIRELGRGSFGKVTLVKYKVDRNVYAMKTIMKKAIIAKSQSSHLRAERDALISLDSVWVTTLHFSFQDRSNLYMILEYISGGDLRHLLCTIDRIPENVVRFYITEIILGVEAVHKAGFIHRDIKPENIMITEKGHIKLTDFGLSTGFHWSHMKDCYLQNYNDDYMVANKILYDHLESDTQNTEEVIELRKMIRELPNMSILERRKALQKARKHANSIVGTILYMAPEVVTGTGHSQSCDWWSVGVIFFEMLTGCPPFYGATYGEVIERIIKFEQGLVPLIVSKLTKKAQSFAKALINIKSARLGKNGASEVKEHPFIKNENWNIDPSRDTAPIIPMDRLINEEIDLKDQESDEAEKKDGTDNFEYSFLSDINNVNVELNMKKLAFKKFTFRRYKKSF